MHTYVAGTVALLALTLSLMAGTADAASTGSIGGVVADAEGHPITTHDVCVEAYSADGGDNYGGMTTDASGNYEITQLPAGSYDVYVYDCYGSARNDLPGYYESNGSTTAVELAAGEAKTGIDVQLEAATSISGHVYGGSGSSTPLSDACIDAYDVNSINNDLVGYAASEADGAYTVAHLAPGVGYKVRFVPCLAGSAYSEDFYDEKASLAEADTVTPTVANPSTGIDGHLPTGASISGTIADAEGHPITTQDICVDAYSDGGDSYGYATTNASGEYTITGLSAGSYYVQFSDCADSARNDVEQYYGGAPDEYESTLVVLSSGGAQTGIDAQLAIATSISGDAYAGTGTGAPLAHQCVYVDARSPSGAGDDYEYYYDEQTNSSGEYTVDHVAPISGGYTVEFTDCSSPVTYVSQYFGGSYALSTASTVTPTVATPAREIDAHLEKGGTISGTVTDSKGSAIGSGVCVDASLVNDDEVYYEEYSDQLTSTGGYTVGGLPSGSYDVNFYDCGSRNDVNQVLPNPVGVTVGEATQGVDASMKPATSISGHVYGGAGTGTPLEGICVEAFSSGGSSIEDYDTGFVDTGTTGSYKLEHLDPSGSYVVEFNTCSYYYGSNGYATQYYDGVSELSQADVLTPTLAAPSSGIDAHLPSGAPVTTITGGPAADAATSQPDARFSFTANVAGATFECALDGAAYSPCTPPYDTGTLASGRHTFAVRATIDGKTEISPRYVTWTIDPSSPTSTSQGDVTSGGTFSSDPGGETSSATPVIVTVTPPSASQVTLTTEPATTPNGNGYAIFGQQIDIAVAEPTGAGTVTGTSSEPIKLVFTLDASQIPAGTEPGSVTVTRNGTAAAPCTTAGVASPDPCVESRTTNAEGNLEIVVLTTHCSTWNFAVPSAPVFEAHTGETSNGGGGATNGGPSTTPTPVSPATTGALGGVLAAKEASDSVSLAGSTITVKHGGEAAVKLSCASTVRCAGRLTLTARTEGKGRRKAKTTTIGSAAFSIPAGKTVGVALTLTAIGRTLLGAARGSLGVTLTITKSSPAPAATRAESVHLVRQKATRGKSAKR